MNSWLHLWSNCKSASHFATLAEKQQRNGEKFPGRGRFGRKHVEKGRFGRFVCFIKYRCFKDTEVI